MEVLQTAEEPSIIRWLPGCLRQQGRAERGQVLRAFCRLRAVEPSMIKYTCCKDGKMHINAQQHKAQMDSNLNEAFFGVTEDTKW